MNCIECGVSSIAHYQANNKLLILCSKRLAYFSLHQSSYIFYFIYVLQGPTKHLKLGEARHFEGTFYLKKKGNFLKIKRALLVYWTEKKLRTHARKLVILSTTIELLARDRKIRQHLTFCSLGLNSRSFSIQTLLYLRLLYDVIFMQFLLCLFIAKSWGGGYGPPLPPPVPTSMLVYR